MAGKLESKLLFQIQDIYDAEKIKLSKAPSQSEVFDILQKKDASIKRLPNSVVNTIVAKFFQGIPNEKTKVTVSNNKSSDDTSPLERDPQKKIKTNPQQTTQQTQGIQPIDLEQLQRFPLLSELGAIDLLRPQLDSTIYLPLNHVEIFQSIGCQPPRGVLLTGPTGCGKTILGQSICRDLNEKFGVNVFIKNASEMVGGLSGESEKNVRALFQAACQNVPSVIFIDEIDVIAGQRDKASKDMEKRVVTQIMSCLDYLPPNVFLIAATSRPDQIDPALRRSGRFDREIIINVPNDQQREQILKVLLKRMIISPLVDVYALARKTPGYVAADLQSLCREAGTLAVKRLSVQTGQTNMNEIIDQDFELAFKSIQPTAKREGFAVIPDVSWSDIGSLHQLRQTLEQSIVLPIQNPEIFEKFAVRVPAGVLLWGPPGCGKTLLAKAVANSSRANFIAVKGPELLNKYVGESEKAIRSLFARARSSQPCIIFFDEIDAICPTRGNESNQATERVVNQLLTELDGFEDRKQVFIIAATNRPDILDPAILRPGRIDKPLYVPLPDDEGKIEILKALSRRSPLDQDVNFDEIVKRSEIQNFTGADLQHLITQAALQSIIGGFQSISQKSILQALTQVKPSLQDSDRKTYEKLKEKWGRC